MFLIPLLFACASSTDTSPSDTSGGGEETGVANDRDGDGVPDDADCLPDDANAYPGHYEVPYNGKDDDCSGGDQTDVDGDGYVGKNGGGDDCDDSNPEINPGEIEHCYDGLDNNCDDWHDETDCDGDGYDISHDCWDDEELAFTNGGGLRPADVHPGAADVWYDGTDADCAGNNDYDQDADGAPTADFAGTDCVDTDAAIGPDMDERWNGVDDDCDGALDAMVPNQATMKVSGDTGREELDFAIPLVFLPDLDGDGRDDLAVGAPASTEYAGWLWILPTTNGVVTPALEALGSLTGIGGTGSGLAVTSVGGSTQLAVGHPWEAEGGLVELYDLSDIADGASVASISQAFGGGALAALGDGRLFVGCTYGATNMAGSTWSGVLGDVSFRDADFFVATDEYQCLDSGSFGDLDGDGFDEIYLGGLGSDGATAYLFLADSDLSRAGGTVRVTDLEDLGTYTFGSYFSSLPDITGDGHDEAVIDNPAFDGASTGDGRAWIIEGDTIGADWSTAAFVTVSGGTSGAALRATNLGDLDNDGAQDLVLGLPGLGRVEFLPISALVGGDVSPSVGAPSFYDSVGADLFGDNAWAHDFDHDGKDDLLVRTDRNAGALQAYFQE